MVVEVSYVEWTPDSLLRHIVPLGERQDKLARRCGAADLMLSSFIAKIGLIGLHR
jgi:hypothetical protein